MEKTGILHVVATPIGNLEDITYRAVRLLKEVDYILCEDTRMTRRLCSAYEIKTPLRRYDAHTSEAAHVRFYGDLQEGKSLALVSDAGTPGVSDPGVLLVRGAREVGADIVAVPGPSAVTAAVSIAGFTGNKFSFLGFVPNKKGRQTFFESIDEYEHPVVFFESTHRIIKTLESLKEHLPNAVVYMSRELTKIHEECTKGTAADILNILENDSVKQRGEFVLIVDPR